MNRTTKEISLLEKLLSEFLEKHAEFMKKRKFNKYDQKPGHLRMHFHTEKDDENEDT